MVPLTGPARPQQRGMAQVVRFTGGGGVVDTVISDHKQVWSPHLGCETSTLRGSLTALSLLACLHNTPRCLGG